MKTKAENLLLSIQAETPMELVDSLALAELACEGCVNPTLAETSTGIGFVLTPKGRAEIDRIKADREAAAAKIEKLQEKAFETLMEMTGSLGEDFIANWLSDACAMQADAVRSSESSKLWAKAAELATRAGQAIKDAAKIEDEFPG
jgi:DNA-binding PadR family transcriptional regulator